MSDECPHCEVLREQYQYQRQRAREGDELRRKLADMVDRLRKRHGDVSHLLAKLSEQMQKELRGDA